METKQVSISNIEFIDNEPFCRWKGVMLTPENCIELFGFDCIEIYTKTNKLIIIGSTLFCSDIKYLVHKISKVSDVKDLDWLLGIKEVLPFEATKKINIKLMEECNKDLDEYYETFKSSLGSS